MLKKKKGHVKTSVFKVMIVNLIAQELPIFEVYILQCIYPLRKKNCWRTVQSLLQRRFSRSRILRHWINAYDENINYSFRVNRNNWFTSFAFPSLYTFFNAKHMSNNMPKSQLFTCGIFSNKSLLSTVIVTVLGVWYFAWNTKLLILIG